MTIFNLGSINADLVYTVPHFPAQGETLAASAYSRGLGGKGANQSVAAARAGAKVIHIGAVGTDGAWALKRLEELGVDTAGIVTSDTATGHAIIYVDENGENEIVIWPGANRGLPLAHVVGVLSHASCNDTLLMQNETDCQKMAAQAARDKGMRILYSAAPFDITAVEEILSLIDILIMNEVEREQLMAQATSRLSGRSLPDMLVTKGAAGAEYHDKQTGKVIFVDSPKVKALDTTGAGDTFAGYFAAGLDLGKNVHEAMKFANSAAALKVTRRGTADAIPSARDVLEFIKRPD